MLHDHFHAGTYCGGRDAAGEWCGCSRFRKSRRLRARLLFRARRIFYRLRMRLSRFTVRRFEDDAARRNLAAFGRFSNPGRLPVWPQERSVQILQCIPRGPRFIPIPPKSRGERL